MFNVFSSAFLDNNNNAKNSTTSGAGGLTGPISGISGQENRPMGLKDRLATVRNVQNILNKKNMNKTGTENEKGEVAEKTTGGLLGLKSAVIAEPKKLIGNSASNLSRFKNYASIVNEKQNEKPTNNENEEEVDKKLKKRKRRKKHEIMMERMKQQEKEKGKYGREEEEDDDEEEQENNAAEEEEEQEEETNKQRYSNVSQNKYNNQAEEEEDEEENEQQKEDRGMSKDFDSFNNINNNNNNNETTGNNEPVKKRRGRRKKSEMEQLKSNANKDKIENKDSFKTTTSNNTGSFNNATGNGEPQVKRRRGRPKLNATNTEKAKPDQLKTYDIRKFCSTNDDNNGVIKKTNSFKENEKSSSIMNGKSNRETSNEDGDNRNIFKIIQTSVQEKDKFMKKSPAEIVQLERNFRYNIKRGITCIPLHYQCEGGGMAIIIVEANSTYGPVRNGNGFMTFLVLECDTNSLFIDTGMKSNVIECEKHMQLLISPGDTYMLKNKSPEMEAQLLLIVCNKMKHVFDPAKDIKG